MASFLLVFLSSVPELILWLWVVFRSYRGHSKSEKLRNRNYWIRRNGSNRRNNSTRLSKLMVGKFGDDDDWSSCMQACTSSAVLATTHDERLDKRAVIDERLKSTLSHTRQMVTCFKKMSVITESNASDSLAIVPSTLMQVMTLERFVLHSVRKSS